MSAITFVLRALAVLRAAPSARAQRAAARPASQAMTGVLQLPRPFPLEPHEVQGAGPLRLGGVNPYDRLAPVYRAAHRVWLTLAGGAAERRLLNDLAGLLGPGDRLLEVGAGTGRLTRRIQTLEPEAIVSALDISTAMLSHAPTTVERIVGDALALPFADSRYDVVVAAWAIETTADPKRALAECARVLRPGGHLLYCHAAEPSGPLRRASSLPTRAIVRRCFGGRFLPFDGPLPPVLKSHARYLTRRQLAASVLARKRT